MLINFQVYVAQIERTQRGESTAVEPVLIDSATLPRNRHCLKAALRTLFLNGNRPGLFWIFFFLDQKLGQFILSELSDTQMSDKKVKKVPQPDKQEALRSLAEIVRSAASRSELG